MSIPRGCQAPLLTFWTSNVTMRRFLGFEKMFDLSLPPPQLWRPSSMRPLRKKGLQTEVVLDRCTVFTHFHGILMETSKWQSGLTHAGALRSHTNAMTGKLFKKAGNLSSTRKPPSPLTRLMMLRAATTHLVKELANHVDRNGNTYAIVTNSCNRTYW